ncbi:hypothetical protein TSOC_012774 [Tetrabaena socialis]|uniref:Uncharacterized protein n=1 Tax=Tetrabaena socialis TaxID=47790 RepID=A0A2J7ZM54_9CHLO|nr:hypothetical protein TSOC_012774 [Tetrabaena socialis]|eukprot:PNH01351.1 hypothetical protein TSOC_012774 [Tetrabaena socialis]
MAPPAGPWRAVTRVVAGATARAEPPVCCVFRRGGQWRVPGLPWLKRKFGRQPESKYSRYMTNNDDGF